MLVIVTVPAARFISVVVSVQVAPSVAPPAGSRGKKFLKPPTIGDSDCAAILSETVWVRKSPLGTSRPMNVSPFAAARLMFIGGNELPESATIESIVTVVGYPTLSAGPLIVTRNRIRSP